MLRGARQLEIVGEAGDGAEGLEVITRTRPDVVLMDIRMPRLDGVEATRRILELVGPRPRVLVLTTFDLDEYVVAAIGAGASGFLLKDAPPAQLLHGIRTVASGVTRSRASASLASTSSSPGPVLPHTSFLWGVRITLIDDAGNIVLDTAAEGTTAGGRG